jgi:hypothetical protein
LRWEWNPNIYEAHDRLSSWNPTKIDPASGLPGAYDFAGDCDICTGKRSFGRPPGVTSDRVSASRIAQRVTG